MYKYYRLMSTYKGQHYFRVHTGESKDVTKITYGIQPKTGVPYCPGITLIKYSTYVTAYGIFKDGLSKNTFIKEITKAEYDMAFKIIMQHLR